MDNLGGSEQELKKTEFTSFVQVLLWGHQYPMIILVEIKEWSLLLPEDNGTNRLSFMYQDPHNLLKMYPLTLCKFSLEGLEGKNDVRRGSVI